MDKEANREKVWKAFNEALKTDRARSNVTKISELGLVEMTRKRTRESLSRKLTEACFYCEGKGYLKSKVTLCYEILRDLRRSGDTVKEDTVVVACHPEIADQLMTTDHEYIDDVEKRLQKRVLVKARASYHMEQYEIMGKKAAEKQGGGGEAKKKDPKEAAERTEKAEKPKEGDGGEANQEARPPR
jgi:ribonuclease G